MLYTLRNNSFSGETLEATFCPDVGMNMVSYKKGEIEIIDQSTRTLFEERSAGLGALIGPHFHHRNPNTIPKIQDESLFPHIQKVRQKGVAEPFSHGIARYAPWKVEAASETKIVGTLSGKDTWNGIPLADLEGQNFKMNYSAELTPEGLLLKLSVISDTDSLVGIHFYYNLPNSTGTIMSRVKDHYIDGKEKKTIPRSWKGNSEHSGNLLQFPLNEAADFTFFPSPNPLEGTVMLNNSSYQLLTKYSCPSQENCWQLYHPAGASFVCIEPISSQDPRHPNLTVSSLQIQLQILSKDATHVI